MPPLTPVTLGRYSYPSRDAATAHLRSMLRSADGSPLPHYPCRLPADDAAAVIASLAYHPDGAARLARQPIAVEVRINPPYMTPGMWLVYADGEALPLSLKSLFRSRGPSCREQLTRALRWEVEGQIRAARDAARWPAPCALTGRLLGSAAARIDHTPPHTLAALADGWLAFISMNPSQIALAHDPASPVAYILADPNLGASWRAYHAGHAKLRIVARDVQAAVREVADVAQGLR